VLKNQTENHSRSQAIYSKEQIASVKYFFGNLKLTYPREYSLNVAATPERESLIRNGSAKYLADYTLEQIDKGFDFIKHEKQMGETKYLKLDVDLCIGAVREANRQRAAHQDFVALPPPTLTKAERNDELAKMRADLDL